MAVMGKAARCKPAPAMRSSRSDAESQLVLSILGVQADMPRLPQLAITQASLFLCFSCSGARLPFYPGSLQGSPILNFP